jgi:hypothetical protein
VSQDISLFLESEFDVESLEPTFQIEPVTLFIPDSVVPIAPVIRRENLVSRFFDSVITAESPEILSPSSIGSRTIIFTDSFAGDFFGPFNPESFEQTQTIVDIDFVAGSTVLFVTNTSGFPSEGELQVGSEVVTYNGTLPDRFFITSREQRGTVSPAIHPVGTLVYLYLENQNINGIIREDIHTDIPEVFAPITASTEVNYITVPNLDVTQPEVQNDSQLSYFIEDELQTVSIESVRSDINLIIQNTPISVSPPEQESETRINVVLDILAEGGLDLSTTETPIFKFYESTADAEAFVLFNIEESNVTLFYEFDAVLTLTEPESTSIIIDVDTVDPVTETILSVSLETTTIELTNFVPGGGGATTIPAAVVEPLTKFIDVDDNQVTIDVIDSVSELITVVEEPATPTPELEESVLDVSAITIQSEIKILTSEIKGVTLITGPEIEAREITKSEDVVSADDDNLDISVEFESTSVADTVSVEVTIDNIDSNITAQIDKAEELIIGPEIEAREITKSEDVVTLDNDNLDINVEFESTSVADPVSAEVTVDSIDSDITAQIDKAAELIIGPEIEAQEITKFPEDVVTLDDDNLDLDSVSEVTSSVDPVSAEVTVDSIDSNITVQIDQGSTDDFIETINTDEIGLN